MSITFPPGLRDRYVITTGAVAQLDQSGEPCPRCQSEDAVIQVQWYGDMAPDVFGQSEPVSGECCLNCLPGDLDNAEVDRTQVVHVEYEAGNAEPLTTDHPAYTEGVKAANLLIDTGEGPQAAFWLSCAEQAAATELAVTADTEDDRYQRMRGMADTLREYQETRT